MKVATTFMIFSSLTAHTFGQQESIDVWSFRQDNLENYNVKATYRGPDFPQEIGDFTICLRYKVLYFNEGNNGIEVLSAEKDGEKLQLMLYNDKWANKFVMQTKNGTRQVIWFDAQVPVRQWNSLCLVRDLKLQKFKVYQNEDLVFSYGECYTIGKPEGLRQSKKPCIEGGWTYKNNQTVDFVGPCTNGFWQSYWCLINITSPDNVYNASTDAWGECSLSCMDLPEHNFNNVVLNYELASDLFTNLVVGSASKDEVSTSLKGEISDLYIWSSAWSQKSIDNFMNCEVDSGQFSLAPWVDWTNYWELTKQGKALSILQNLRSHLCRREDFRKYVGFVEKMNYEKAMKLCSSMGGRLPMSDDASEEASLWTIFSDEKNLCKGDIWMGITDIQREGEFWNVSRHTYEDVFVYDEKVGQPLNSERWVPNQPNGGVTENCVVSTPDSKGNESWRDFTCDRASCVACTIKANQFYILHGLCLKTKFDVKFKIDFDTESRKHKFIGEYGWELKWSEIHNGYLLQNLGRSDAVAIYNDTQEYPMGLRGWKIINDNCPTLQTQFLLFSSCDDDQFSCNDGSCIPAKQRCDAIQHCSDNSDEIGCQKVSFVAGAYSKDKAPVLKFPQGRDGRILVNLAFKELTITDIDYLKSIFQARFWLAMQWHDLRLTFTYLKDDALLAKADVDKLWFPSLNFEDTPQISQSKRDDTLVVYAIGTNPRTKKDLSLLHDESPFYSGDDVLIDAQNLYNEIFTCAFDLQMYPFDSQICCMRFNVVKHQKKFVRLNSDCSLEYVNHGEVMTIGEFKIVQMQCFQPRNSSGELINVRIDITRAVGKMFSTTYLPTLCLLVLVQMTFYFPEHNFQVRATVSLSCLLILSTLFASTSRGLPTTTQVTFLEIWMMIAVLLTFFQVILHTIIGYVQELEKTNKAFFVRVKSHVTQGKIEAPLAKPLSCKINYYGGRVAFPFIFLFCTITYFLTALIHYHNGTRFDEEIDVCHK